MDASYFSFYYNSRDKIVPPPISNELKSATNPNPNPPPKPLSFAIVFNTAATSPSIGNFNDKMARARISNAGNGYKAVKSLADFYKDKISSCQHSVIERLTHLKGDKPWKHKDIKRKLNSIWNRKMDWKLISLGRGFYHIIMPSGDAVQKIWYARSLNLKLGIMQFSVWKAGFDPVKHKQMMA